MRKLLAGFVASLALALGTGTAQAQQPLGCSTCGPAGCDGGSASKFNLFGHFGNSGCDTCGNGCSGGFNFHWNFPVLTWVKAPCPLGAPTRRIDAPLGFPTSPYTRSPRDYFMID